jgi:hypothetical protein
MLGEEASAMDVGAWLTSVRPEFAKYAQLAVDNDVSGATILYAPTDEVLGMLGVTSVGHKHLLRKAITVAREENEAQEQAREQQQEEARPDEQEQHEVGRACVVCVVGGRMKGPQ